MSLLSCRGVVVRYGGLRAVQGVDVDVAAGATVTIVGANGAGKTSFLRAISGLEPCSGGTIHFGGRDVTSASAPEMVGLGLSMVPDARQLFPNLSVRKNLWLGAHLRTRKRSAWRDVEADLQALYTHYPILESRSRQAAGSLSGGEQQIVAIGRALMARPRIMILDEPSLGLAPLILGDIVRGLQALVAGSDTALLLVEQNVDIALRLAQRVYVMENGRVVDEGDAGDFTSEGLGQRYLGVTDV